MIERVFSEGGALSAALAKAGKPAQARDPQRRYAEHVASMIAARKPAFLDAETGVGKTLGYLVPTMLAAFGGKEKKALVVVSTATVALQRQLQREDVPLAAAVVRDLLGVDVRAEIRVGREQVVDPDRLEAAAAELAAPAEAVLAAEMLGWVSERISLDELPLRADMMEAFSERIQSRLPWLSSALIGLQGDDAAGGAGELYDRLLERCDEADVLVVNHHLLALNLLRPFLWDEKRPVHVVVDEADRLPRIVEELSRRMVPLHMLSAAAASFGKTEAVRDAVEALSSEASAHFDNAWIGSGGGVTAMSRLDRSERASIGQRLQVVVSTLDATIARLTKERPVRSAELRERLAYMERARSELSAIGEELDNPGGNALLYYSPVRRYPGIASVRPGSSRMIASRLWTKSPFDVRSLTFTSATLGTMASPSAETDAKRALTPFITECGFPIAEVEQSSCALIAPDRFGEMSFVRPPIDGPTPFQSSDDDADAVLRPEAIELWARMIRAAAAEGGRTLVLVPSHRDVKALERVLAALGDRLLAQTGGLPTGAAVARFLAEADTVWISASAWEGVSLPGAISQIVIPRLPIRPSILEDNLVERYFDQAGSAAKGKSVVFGRRMADARRRLRQGIGRGIRSGDDRVKVWICDPRWPLSQAEMDRELRDQPTTWSPAMLNAVPRRFRKKLETSPRFS